MLGFDESTFNTRRTMTTKSPAERRTRFETSSGIDLPADYNPSNTEPVEYEKDLNSPGDFP